jgi:uncharacterized membrane protein YkvI
MSELNPSEQPSPGGEGSVRTIAKLAGAFVAFLLGSGFATGQETMQFFAAEGLKGVLGALVFLAVCTYLTITLLLVGRRHGFHSLDQVFRHYTGNIIGPVYTWYTIVMVFSIYVVMLAGADSVMAEQFGLPIGVGAAIMAAVVLATLFFGLREIVNVIGAIGPVLVGLVIFIAVVAIAKDPAAIAIGNQAAPSLQTLKASGTWWWSAVLYTALQVMGLFGFLPALGATVRSSRDLVLAGFLGPLLYSVALVLVILAFVAGLPRIVGSMIPMLQVAQHATPVLATGFSLVIIAGIFTTAVPMLWIVLVRFVPDNSRPYRRLAVVLSLVGAAGASWLPFDRLLNLVYPTIGYSGIVLIGFVLAKQLRTRSLA